jgi:hypothetical protein
MQELPVAPRRPERSIEILLLLAIVTLGSLAGCGSEALPRPNLVLITVDRLAADRLACFGGEPDTGSSICALGEGGTLFAWTASLGRGEASGVASVLTGLREVDHHVGPDGQSFLPDATETLAEDLSRAGYATAAFVTRPRVNVSRRLDQGFDLYDDRVPPVAERERPQSIDLADRMHDWTASAHAPWFVWIHADRDEGVVELDRLISRLSQTFDDKTEGPGILFVALAGEASAIGSDPLISNRSIDWSTHRVPMLWRPPPRKGTPPSRVSRELTSLLDIRPTIQSAARITPRPETPNRVLEGRNLDHIASDGSSGEGDGDNKEDGRFVLLEVIDESADREVGLATKTHLYARRSSPIDGGGRPIPTDQLLPLSARFATILPDDSAPFSMGGSAQLEAGPWRKDVLSSQSPVPRLEFHLARLLGPSLPKEPE